jgi:hypothetical protein
MIFSTSIVIFVHGVAKKIKAITKSRTKYPYRINLKNTKILMIFFVISFFRDFVIKELLRLARVRRLLPILPVVCLLTLVSCGPETILLRPGLDTPFQHVDNGNKLMAYGKIDAAIREFKRSMELDAAYSPAYVGLGIASGVKGDLDQGRVLMEKAKTLARSDEQKKEVKMGFERLDYIERGN